METIPYLMNNYSILFKLLSSLLAVRPVFADRKVIFPIFSLLINIVSHGCDKTLRKFDTNKALCDAKAVTLMAHDRLLNSYWSTLLSAPNADSVTNMAVFVAM